MNAATNAPDEAAGATNWRGLTPEQAAEQLGVHSTTRLSAVETRQRLQTYGPNVLAEANAGPAWKP